MWESRYRAVPAGAGARLARLCELDLDVILLYTAVKYIIAVLETAHEIKRGRLQHAA